MALDRDAIIRRGKAAAGLLENGTFMEAMAALEAEMCEKWKASNPAHADERERLYVMVQIMADLGRVLSAWAGHATVEEHLAERDLRDRQGLTPFH